MEICKGYHAFAEVCIRTVSNLSGKYWSDVQLFDEVMPTLDIAFVFITKYKDKAPLLNKKNKCPTILSIRKTIL